MECFLCGQHLDAYDIGCYKKLINRGAVRFLCRTCLASDLGWSREELDALIVRFQKQGCMLFPPLSEKEQS